MKLLRYVALSLALLSAPAAAQWQTPNHSVPIGRGVSAVGFGSAVPGTTDQPLVSNGASADPSFRGLPNTGLANEAANTVKCNPTGSPAVVQDCTPAQIATLISLGTNPVVGTYTVLTTDCGKTITAGGSAFYTITANIASGYPATCSFTIVDTDNACPSGGATTCRGKTIAINGNPNFILWPGQVIQVSNQNNVWQFNQPGRWAPLVGMTWHINHAIGNNNSDGLVVGAGAFATIQRCIDVVEGLVDFGTANIGPTCKNDPETFTENNATHTHPLTGYHVISLTGDTTTPSNVVWQVSGTGNTAYQGRDTGMAIVTGFRFVSTGTGNNFIQGGQLAVADFGSIEFGANPGGYDIHLTPGGSANYFGGTLTITGDMAGWILTDGEGHILLDGATVSVPSARTFTNFVQLSALSTVSMTSMTFTGAGAGAGSTGSKYSVKLNSVLSLSGSVLPGASAGTTATGGQVVP